MLTNTPGAEFASNTDQKPSPRGSDAVSHRLIHMFCA